MDLGLEGRVALVTGAAAGIGAAIAEALAREGCMVHIGDRDLAGAAALAARMGESKLAAAPLFMDVADPDGVAAAIDGIAAGEGRLDVLVCNAGILATGTFLETPAATWDKVLAINLAGVANCARAAARLMEPRGRGSIVNIASISAERGGGSIGNVVYGTSKAGVVALTRGLARELGPLGITVNAIAPSVADTPMTRETLTGEVRARIVARVPLRRLATPDDIADAVLFLASERARFISGAILPVDGGLLTT